MSAAYDTARLPVLRRPATCSSAAPSLPSTRPARWSKPDFDPGLKLVEQPDGWYLDITLDPAWAADRPASS